MNSFTTIIYTFKVSKHIIIEQSMDINVFLFFPVLSCFFKLRESGIQNLGIKEKCPQSYLSYFFSTGESFLFHGLIDFVLFFYTGLKNLGPSCPRYVFVFFTRSNGYGSVCHEPLPITNFLIIYFR